MMCENCVSVTNALTAAELTFGWIWRRENVTIDGCENCVKTAVSRRWRIWASPRRSRAERQRTPEKAPVSGFGYRYFFTRKIGYKL